MNRLGLSKRATTFAVSSGVIALTFLFYKNIIYPSILLGGNSRIADARKSSNFNSVSGSHRSSAINERKTRFITPALAAATLKKIESLPDIKKRREQSYLVIHDLCKAGYHEEAWALIDPNSGLVRKWELAAFFEHSDLDMPQLIEKLNALTYKDEVTEALNTQLSSLSLTEVKKFIKDNAFTAYVSSKQHEEPFFLQKLLQQDLLTRASSSIEASKSESLQQAIQWHAEGLVDEKSLIKIVARDPNPDPWQRWDLLSKYIKSTNSESFPGAVRVGAIDRMVETDAKKAVEFLTGGEGEQGAWDLLRGIRKWTAIDPTATNDWYQANKASLSDIQRDAAVEAFYDLARQYGEVEGAASWANQIGDPEKKKTLLRQLLPLTKDHPPK